MKIVIPGGSGHLGGILSRHFLAKGHEVVVLTRQQNEVQTAKNGNLTIVPWDAENVEYDWASHVDGADVVINLAGRSVNCRYGSENRRQITNSRVNSTRAVGDAIARAKVPPPIWLQMSTATIYAHRFDKANDEFEGIIGGHEPGVPETWNFSIGVATSWERTLDEAIVPPGTRKVKLRTAIVMSPVRGGPFDILLRLVRFGLGGQQGDGRQYISWISDTDFVRSIDFLLEQKELSGPVNICAPNPIPNESFMRILREAWGMPFGLPAYTWMVEVGAVVIQTESELILKSRRVVPGKLLASGFEFELPLWGEAARDLCERWRAQGA